MVGYRSVANEPRPLLVTIASSFLALLVIFQQHYATRWGIPTPWLFVKEGPLEDFTCIAELVAAGFMAIAARLVWRRELGSERKLIVCAYALCAAGLFAVGMEEISWGQQLLHFATPHSWEQINHQQETTLHNLLDKSTLTIAERYAAVLFGCAAIALAAFGTKTANRLIAAIAPHVSLIPLACIVVYAGWKLHAEIIEAFLALFFLFYSYRAFKNRAGPIPAAIRRRPECRLSAANNGRSSPTQ